MEEKKRSTGKRNARKRTNNSSDKTKKEKEKQKIIEKAYEDELETEELKMDSKINVFLNSKSNLKKYELIIFSILLVAASVFLTMVITNELHSSSKVLNSKTTGNSISEVEEVYNLLNKEYYIKPNKAKLIEGAIDGMLDSLNDPHTSYFTVSETEQFDDIMLGSYEGIGAEISLDNDKNVIVFSVFKNSPAAEVGLKFGDIITEVNGVSTKDMTTSEVVALIKDPTKPIANIKITRDGKTLEFKITKRVIELESVESKIYQKNGKKIGYIAINNFADNTYNQFKNELLSLEKDNITSLVIDVRNNTGGYLHSVTSMLNILLPENSIMYQISDNKGTQKYKSTSNESRNYPIAVLVNSSSASASEILAVALKESCDAEVIGTTTYGKGTVQTTKRLPNGSMIKYTIQKWLSPKGNWINEKGVKPTIEIELDDNYLNNPSEENDLQLQKALNVLSNKQ